jgi:hypothetical protein
MLSAAEASPKINSRRILMANTKTLASRITEMDSTPFAPITSLTIALILILGIACVPIDLK